MKKTNLLKSTLACCSTLVLLSSVSCKKAEEKCTMKAFDMVAAQKSIDSCNTAFTSAFNKGDASGVANCYVADAKFMPPNTTSKDGMPAIQTEIDGYLKGGVAHLELKTIGLWGDDNLLVEEGSFVIADKDGKHLDHGKSLLAYKKDGGHWKIFRDCYNSDMPVMPPAPAESALTPPKK